MRVGGALRFRGPSELEILPLAGDLSEHELQPLGQRGHRSTPLGKLASSRIWTASLPQLSPGVQRDVASRPARPWSEESSVRS
jgi:hypothetical protein